MRHEQRECAAFALAAAYTTKASPTICSSFRPSSPARSAGSRAPSWRPTSARSASSHYRPDFGQRNAAGRANVSATYTSHGRGGGDNGRNILGADFRRRREDTPRRRRAITRVARGTKAAAPGFFDCETLQDETLRLKLALNRATEENKRYRANRTRLERELLRADGKVEMLLTELEQPIGHRDQRVLDNARREVEKCAVVRTLAQQKENLQKLLARRERDLEALKQTQEWSAVAEMAAATEEYFLETQRLQCLLAQRQHVDEAALFPDNDDQWRGDARGDTVVREEYTPPNSRHTRPSVNEPGWDRRRLQENRPAMLRGPTRNVRGRQPQSTDIKAIVRGKDCKDNMHSIDSCSHRRRRSRQSVDEGIMVAPEVPDNGFHGIRTSDGKVYHQRPPSPIRRGSPPRAARMAPRAASIEIVPTSPTSPGARMRPSDREGVGSPDWPGSQGRRNPAIAKRGGTRAQVAKWMASCSAEARAGGMLASRRSRPVSAPSSRDCMDEQPGAASRGDQASWGRRSHNALSPGYKRREDARSRSSVDAHFDDDTVAMASAAGQRANHMPLWTVQSERHGEEMMSADELPDNDASDRMPSPRATPDFGLEGNVPSREHDVPRSTPNEADCTTARRCRHVDGERGGEATATLTHHSREGEKPRGSREDAAENFVHTRTDGSDGGNTPVCVHDNDDNSNGRGEPDKSVTSSTSALLPDDGSDFRSEHHSVASPLESGISLAELGERSVTSGAPSGGEKGVSSIPTAGGLPQSRSSTPYSMPTVSLREWGERETMPPPITTGSRFSSCHGESTTVACCSVTSVVAAGSTHSNASSPSTARNKGRPEKGADAGVGSSVDSQASTVNSAGRQEGSRQRAVAASRLVHDGGGKRAAIEAGKGGGTGEETPPELNGRGQLADAPSTEEAIISTPRGASDEDHHYTQDAVDDDGGTYDVERSLLRESLAEEQPLETDAALRQEANSNSRNSRRTPGTIGDSDDTGNSGNVRASREDDRGYALSALNSGMVSGGGVGAAEAEKDAAVVTDSRGSVGANSGVHDSVSRRRDSSGDSGPLVAVQGQCEITAESKDSSSVVVVVGSEGGGEGSEYGDDFDEEDD